MKTKTLNKITSCFLIIAVIIAFTPFITADAYASSKYGTKSARIAQNEKMYEKASKISSSDRKKYLNTSLSDMYETKYKGMSKAEQAEIKAFAEELLEEAGNPTDDMKKIKVFHDWIKYNFYYYRNVDKLDVTVKYSNKISTKGCVDSPAALIKMYKNMEAENLKGVISRCNGYGATFIAFCRSQGIPAVAVDGYYNQDVRHNADAYITWAPDKDEIDHHWAMAYVNGSWVQVDCNADCYNQYKSGSTYWKQSSGSYASGERYNYFNPTVERLSQSHIILEYRALFKINAPSVSIQKSGSKSVKISWSKPYRALTYKVYRATSKNGEYKCIKTTSSSSYTDKTVKKGKRYYYKVKAYNGTISSSYSKTRNIYI